MTLISTLSREQFIGWLGGSFAPKLEPLHERVSLPRLTKEEVLLLWQDKSTDGDLKPVIVVRGQDLQNFLSFTATYVSTFVPFTAFFRVVPLEFAPSVLDAAVSGTGTNFPAELVGVAIAEAAIQIGERAKTVSEISVFAGQATLSNAMLAALRSGYEPTVISKVAFNWGRARHFLNDEALRLRIELIEGFWKKVSCAMAGGRTVVKDAVSRGDPAENFVRTYLNQREIDPRAWDFLTADLPDFRQALRAVQGPREDQVRAFDGFVRVLVAADHIDRQTREIIAGALIALIAQGSFKYLPMAQSLGANLPTVALWFGLFAALHRASDVMTIGDCLGRRLMRHDVRPQSLMAPPEADLAIDELEVLVGDGRSETRFRTDFPTSVSVELVPGVWGRFRALRGNRLDTEESTRPSKLELSELRQLLRRASRLTEHLDGSNRSEQTEFFYERTSRSKNPREGSDR